MDDEIASIAAEQHSVFTRHQARDAGFSRATIALRVRTKPLGRGHQGRVPDRGDTADRSIHRDGHGAVRRTRRRRDGDDRARTPRGSGLRPAPGDARQRTVGPTPTRWRAWSRHSASPSLTARPSTTSRARPSRVRSSISAAKSEPRALARAVDAALAARMVTVPEILQVIDDISERGRRGAPLLRMVVEPRAEGYQPPTTVLEARFLELIDESGITAPERQVSLGGRLGWIGTVDFAWSERTRHRRDRRRHVSQQHHRSRQRRAPRSRARSSKGGSCCASTGTT